MITAQEIETYKRNKAGARVIRLTHGVLEMCKGDFSAAVMLEAIMEAHYFESGGPPGYTRFSEDDAWASTHMMSKTACLTIARLKRWGFIRIVVRKNDAGVRQRYIALDDNVLSTAWASAIDRCPQKKSYDQIPVTGISEKH